MKMPKRLQERRDRLRMQPEKWEAPCCECAHDFDNGFNACWQELAPVVEALDELVDIVRGVIEDGDKVDSFTTQPARQALDKLK